MVKDKHIISGINGFFHKAPYFCYETDRLATPFYEDTFAG